jgi:hypothetical protein
MQLEAILFALILFLIIPFIIIFSDDNVFFVVLSILLLINALKNINTFSNRKKYKIISDNSEFQEEFQQITNIDYKKFTMGLKVSGNFIFITFFIYCLFFVNSAILSFITSIILIYWIKESYNIVSGSKNLTNYYINNFYSLPKSLFKSIVSIFTLILIFYVTFIKFF